MKCEDINTCLDIWRENGLNEGYLTVVSSFKADPEGFYVAIDDETGKLIRRERERAVINVLSDASD